MEVLCGIYRHFKGREYRVFGTFVHSETNEEFVAYQALYPPYAQCVRPKAMFVEEVDKPEFGYRGPRFVLVRPL